MLKCEEGSCNDMRVCLLIYIYIYIYVCVLYIFCVCVCVNKCQSACDCKYSFAMGFVEGHLCADESF